MCIYVRVVVYWTTLMPKMYINSAVHSVSAQGPSSGVQNDYNLVQSTNLQIIVSKG